MTSIEWTHRPGTTGESWNPIRARWKAAPREGAGWFCVHVSEGCRNCYAERMNRWRGNGKNYAAQERADLEIFLDRKAIRAPLSWRKPRTVFVCSMTDLFGEFHDDTTIDRVFAAMALAPAHTFLVLTKRAKRMREYMATPLRKRAIAEAVLFVSEVCARAAGTWKARPSMAAFEAAFPRHDGSPFPNVWLGVSVENQATADERIPELLATPAALRFVSYEPALGKVDFHNLTTDTTAIGWIDALKCIVPRRLDWIIAGGESGPRARPAHPDWFRRPRDQCAAAGVPFFFKQWGEWAPDHPFDNVTKRGLFVRLDGTVPAESDLPVLESGTFDFGGCAHMSAIGKARAGATLDGREHRAWP